MCIKYCFDDNILPVGTSSLFNQILMNELFQIFDIINDFMENISAYPNIFDSFLRIDFMSQMASTL